MVNSKLYTGVVRHRRKPPRAYQFSYGVFYLGLDLDEIDEVDRGIKLFSHNRRNVLSFLDSDHMGDGAGIRDAAHRRLESIGIDPGESSVILLTNARILGYVFNPVSFYFVRDRADVLRHVIAEVHNTHGERHVYDLIRRWDEGVYASGVDKQFYVSPFIDMDARYEFRVEERDGGGYRVAIDEYRDGELFFEADLTVTPRPLTNVNVAKMLARYPIMTLRTIALIHWHGLKLWMRGERYRKHTPKREAHP